MIPEPKSTVHNAQILSFPVQPIPVRLEAQLDELAEQLQEIPDHIMLAYIVSRYEQQEILHAFHR